MRNPSAARTFAREFLEALGFSRERWSGPGFVVAFVGAGGKTSALFAAAEGALPYRVIATTTTHIRDPRGESGRIFDTVLTNRLLERLKDEPTPDPLPNIRPRAGHGPLVVASEVTDDGKLAGIHPSRANELRSVCDLLLVEADGARGRSVKAPSRTEPLIPSCANTVVGVIGLDCVGKPMDELCVHRPELFGSLTGCVSGRLIHPEHLVRLAVSPEGLFKSAPYGARRIVLLNKTDVATIETANAVRTALEAACIPGISGAPDAFKILTCSLANAVWAEKETSARDRRCILGDEVST